MLDRLHTAQLSSQALRLALLDAVEQCLRVLERPILSRLDRHELLDTGPAIRAYT